jgi:hypothetical protein
VRLSVPLDELVADEAAALPLAQDGRLDVGYKVALNLGAERHALAGELARMYRKKAGLQLAASQPVTEAALKELLEPVAQQGWSILNRLIFNAEPCCYFSHADVAQRAVTSALARGQLIDIAHSSEPLFPWALLFDGRGWRSRDLSTLDVQRFWGFQHEIQERVTGTSPLWQIHGAPRIVTSICSDADADDLHGDADHPLRKYPHTVDSPTLPELEQALTRFDGHCLYFFGHAGHDHEPPVPTQSWIALRGLRLTVADLQTMNAPQFQNDLVVVFLNGCGTSTLGTWNADSLPGHLCARGRGRVCCIATVAEVPTVFAAEFARHFWASFVLEQRPIGVALLHARRTMLESPLRSPLGLFYTLFGRIDTCIAG